MLVWVDISNHTSKPKSSRPFFYMFRPAPPQGLSPHHVCCDQDQAQADPKAHQGRGMGGCCRSGEGGVEGGKRAGSECIHCVSVMVVERICRHLLKYLCQTQTRLCWSCSEQIRETRGSGEGVATGYQTLSGAGIGVSRIDETVYRWRGLGEAAGVDKGSGCAGCREVSSTSYGCRSLADRFAPLPDKTRKKHQNSFSD